MNEWNKNKNEKINKTNKQKDKENPRCRSFYNSFGIVKLRVLYTEKIHFEVSKWLY